MNALAAVAVGGMGLTEELVIALIRIAIPLVLLGIAAYLALTPPPEGQ